MIFYREVASMNNDTFNGSRLFLNIPVTVANDPRIKSDKSILIFGEIYSMLNVTGAFFMGTEELAKRRRCSEQTIYNCLKELENLGYIKRESVTNDRGKTIGRKIVLGDTLKSTLCGGSNTLEGVPKTHLTQIEQYNKTINKSLFTQDSINNKGIGILAESDGDNKNKGKIKNKDNNKKDYEDDKESSSNINKNRVNTNKDLKGSIDNECSKDRDRVNTKIDLEGNIDNECRIDKKESKGRGSSVNTKIDDTCKIDDECSIENEKKHSHGIDNTCSIDNKNNFDYKRFIDWFNKETGKRFRDTETNRKMIRSRLNEGYTKEDVAKVVRLKVQQWKDNQKMNKYLRFTTLFAATNFSNYLQEAEDTLEPQKRKERESSAKEKQRKLDPVAEKISQYKGFLREHPDNEVVRKALEQLEQNAEEALEPQKKKRESSAKEKARETDPVAEKISQYKLFLREHPDNEIIRKALEQLEQSKE